jgi:hypothetical protein
MAHKSRNLSEHFSVILRLVSAIISNYCLGRHFRPVKKSLALALALALPLALALAVALAVALALAFD